MNFICFLLFRENVMCWSHPCTMGCVDRIPKMTESLYHNVVRRGLPRGWTIGELIVAVYVLAN